MQTTKVYFMFLVLSCVLAAGKTSYAMKGELQAGTAKITITPKETRNPVHDTCYARSLVLDIGGERIAFVSVDLGIYTSESLAKECKEKFGLSQFLLSSSHTHSGPGRGSSDSFEKQIIQVVG
jgi:neutral ceramidase